MDSDVWKLMTWISILVAAVIILVVFAWLVPNEPYIVKVDVCDTNSIDLEVIRTICVNHCTENLAYDDDKIKQCYLSCRGIS